MTDPTLTERLRARIHELVNKGAEVCPQFVVPLPSRFDTGCRTCGYTLDIHLLREALTALQSASPRETELPLGTAAGADSERPPSTASDLVIRIEQLAKRWCEKEQALCRKADGVDGTMWAGLLSARAEAIADCETELSQLLQPSPAPAGETQR